LLTTAVSFATLPFMMINTHTTNSAAAAAASRTSGLVCCAV